MLVFSRKIQESVVIGDTDRFKRVFKVTVIGISGGRVELGFEVNPDVPVDYSELYRHPQVTPRISAIS